MTPEKKRAPIRRPAVKHGVEIGTLADWTRLGDLLRRRRGEMRFQYKKHFLEDRTRDLGLVPGSREAVSRRDLMDIENAPPSKRPGSWMAETLERIAPYYETTVDSMLAVVRGDATELVRVPAGRPDEEEGPMTDRAREQATRPYVTDLQEAISDYQDRNRRTPRERIPGSALFDDPWFAAKWDDPPSWMSFKQRVWMLADLMRMADASRRPNRSDRSA